MTMRMFGSFDIAPYAKRFDIDLCATGVIDEQQLLSLFEDGIAQAQGPHIGRAGPVQDALFPRVVNLVKVPGTVAAAGPDPAPPPAEEQPETGP